MSLSFVRRFFRRHFRAIRTCFHQLSSAPVASLATFVVIGVSLSLPLALSVLLHNLQGLSQGWDKSSQITLFMKDNMTPRRVNDFLQSVRTNIYVQEAQSISPSAAVQELQKLTGATQVLKDLKVNPLPWVVVLTPKHPHALSRINSLAKSLQQLPEVDSVQMNSQWLTKLHAIFALAYKIVLALLTLLGLMVFLIVNNTIRLVTQKHRQEVKVMKLVGATTEFIRRPFLYAGAIYGLVGGIIAWQLVDLLLFWLQDPIQALATQYHMVFGTVGISLSSTALLLLVSAVLGYLGSWMAVKKHLLVS